jgi:DNA-binding transcriptional regulator YhcF (GntR family)
MKTVNINIAQKTALSTKVSQSIRQRIKANIYRPGDKLPSLRTFSREFSVSSNVIYRAFKELKEDNLLVIQHGRGVWVRPDYPCLNDAVFYATVLPFGLDLNFSLQIIFHAEQTFDRRQNLMFIRSSQNDAKQERNISERLYNNGTLGLLLWPVENSPNGEFFNSLSKKIPVVTVDRQIDGCNQPSVGMDFRAAGRDVFDYMLIKRKRKRMLVIIDNIKISNYQELADGIQEEARSIKRFNDVTILYLPLTQLIRKLNVADYSDVDMFRDNIAQHIELGKYDAIFCPQEEFLESVVIEPGLHRQYSLLMGTMTGPLLTRSRLYYDSGVIRWLWDIPKMISLAADKLQNPADSKTALHTRIPITRIGAK